jgi:hypothetical protein
VALCWTAGVAASTDGYPVIIKQSFDSLLSPDSGELPWVVAAVMGITV